MSESLFASREQNPNRTVHAERDDMQIVRYDSAGKWYEEGFTSAGLFYRRHIGVGEAARMTRTLYLTIHFDRPGGSVFDRKVRALGV